MLALVAGWAALGAAGPTAPVPPAPSPTARGGADNLHPSELDASGAAPAARPPTPPGRADLPPDGTIASTAGATMGAAGPVARHRWADDASPWLEALASGDEPRRYGALIQARAHRRTIPEHLLQAMLLGGSSTRLRLAALDAWADRLDGDPAAQHALFEAALRVADDVVRTEAWERLRELGQPRAGALHGAPVGATIAPAVP